MGGAAEPKPPAAAERDSGVRSVRLTLDVLEILAHAKGEMGVTEIAAQLGVSKPSVFRHLSTLVERGYLAQNPATSRYHWGPRLFLLGRVAPPRFDLATAAEPAMTALRDQLDETVVISAPSATELTVLATIGSNKQIEIGVQSGSKLALHASAQGKIALAFGADSLRAHVAATPLAPYTPHTITQRKRLETEVAMARKRGWAVAPGEVMLGINTLAVPVFDGSGSFVATLAMVGLLQVIGTDPKTLQIAPMQQAATRITQALMAAAGENARDR
jgi:DNA-binding IclR family transcriptional regulator